jgi:hypothetical protein
VRYKKLMPAFHRLLTIFTISLLLAGLTGCLTDPATRLAYDIERGASLLAMTEGSRYKIEHRTPSKTGACHQAYKVQLDQVGALIIWCKDNNGNTASSHSTSYQSRFIVVPRTIIVTKTAGSTLIIELERRNGNAVVTDLY